MIDTFIAPALNLPHEQITALVIHPAAIGYELFLQTVNMGLVRLGYFKNLEYTKRLACDLHSSQGWPVHDHTEK